MQAKRSHDETINRVAWLGDVESGLPGLLSNVNIPTYVIPANGTGSSKLFINKSPDQIIDDVNGLINAPLKATKGVHRVNEIWFDINTYAYLASKRISATTDTTILAFLQSVNQGVTFRSLLEVGSTATGGLNGATNTIIALDNSIENYQLNIAMMFYQHSPEQRGLEFVIPCESRFAGVTVEYPLAFVKADSV